MRSVVALEGLSREDWLAARRQGIGGSDVAAILGLDRFRGPFDVYVSKVTEEEQTSTSLMRLGNYMEDGIALAYADETGSVVTKPTHLYQHDDIDWMIGSPDRFTDSEGLGVLEIKMTSRPDDLADGAPDGWNLQCLWYLAITGLPYADIAALVGGRELRYYRVERDDETIANLIKLARTFWQRVLDRDPPPVDARSGESLKRLYGDGGSGTVELAPNMATVVNDYRTAKAAEKVAIERSKGLGNEIRAALGDAEIGTLGGVPIVTNSRSLRTGIDVKALEEQMPEVADKFRKAVPVRTLRPKKGHQ